MGLQSTINMFDLSTSDLEVRILDCQIGKSDLPHAVTCDPHALPKLNFDDESFNLALVNHYLFTKTDSLSLDYHIKAIEELVRVANEARIFPLVTEKGQLSAYVGDVVSKLQAKGYGVEIRSVKDTDGAAMLRVWAPECRVPSTR